MSKPTKVVTSAVAQGLSFALWLSEDGKRYSLKLQKSYKDKSGEWKNSDFIDSRDLPALMFLAQKTASWVDHQREKQKASAPQNTEVQQPVKAPASDYDDDDIPF